MSIINGQNGISQGGVYTFVQGTVVQGPFGHKSKKTFVQGDIGPRRLLSKVKV